MESQPDLTLNWQSKKLREKTSKRKLQEKLKFAIKKREIVSEEMKRLRTVANGLKGIPKTKHKKIKKPRLTKTKPFIRHYLKVYRELCGKYNNHEIINEVNRRWSILPKKNISITEVDFPSNETSKVELALRKRNIISQEMSRLTNLAIKLKKKKQTSSDFQKFYLTVYRELCGKCDPTEIAQEAKKLWKDYITSKKGNSRTKLYYNMKTELKKSFL